MAQPAGRVRATGTDPPAISVVVLAYQSRDRIDAPLRSLRAQDTEDAWEVIVVDSGNDGTAGYVAEHYPEVRVVRSDRRLRPGPGRNRGVREARGHYVAFLPDDGVAEPEWLRRRLAAHRDGHAAVGGAVTNGTPYHPVGSAGYYAEYADLIPSERVLARQAVPHNLSYERALVERLGGFPEAPEPGEDTILNRRILESGASVTFDADIRLAHVNLRGLREYLRHMRDHGRGLMRVVERGTMRSIVGPVRQPAPVAAARMLLLFPAWRWSRALGLVALGRPRCVPGFLVLSPLVWAGLAASGWGAWREWRALTPR